MGRRGNNEGSISQRSDDRWMGQVSMPDGSRRTVYGKTRNEVNKKLFEVQKEAERLHYLGSSTRFRTMREYLQTWLINVKLSVKPRTAQFYEYIINHYAEDIADLAPSQLKPQHLQKIYTKLLERGLSSSTVRRFHATMHRALEIGMRQGVFVQNVADLVDPPRNSQQEMQTLNASQSRIFLEAIHGDRFEALLALAIGTGMRQGELLGLTWDNVDLERGIIYVKRNMQWVDNEPLMQTPKTEKSRRMIFIGSLVRELLTQHLENQQVREAAMADTWERRWNLVFRNTTGRAMHPGTLTHRHFVPALERGQLPRIRFHDLRHTAATLLLEAGINPKVVSEMLGHSSVSITLSLYSHATPAMHYTASVVMDKVLRGEINPLSLPEHLDVSKDKLQ